MAKATETSSKKLLKAINSWSATTIKQIDTIPEIHLNKIIAGQLSSCITAHGNITPKHIGSVSKRMTKQILAIVRDKNE